jgi:hypothetical protein
MGRVGASYYSGPDWLSLEPSKGLKAFSMPACDADRCRNRHEQVPHRRAVPLTTRRAGETSGLDRRRCRNRSRGRGSLVEVRSLRAPHPTPLRPSRPGGRPPLLSRCHRPARLGRRPTRCRIGRVRYVLATMIAIGACAVYVTVALAASVAQAPSLPGCASAWNRTGPSSQRATVVKGHAREALIIAGSTVCEIQFTMWGSRQAVAEGIWTNGNVPNWLPLRVIMVSGTLIFRPNASVHAGGTLKYPA